MHILQGYDAAEFVVVGQHRKAEDIGLLEQGHDLGKRRILMDGYRFAPHHLADLDALHDVHVPAFDKADAAFGQFHGVDGFRMQPLGEIAGSHPGDHQRQDHEVVVAHFKHDQHRRERCPGSSRKERRHADQGKSAGVIAD